MDCLGSASTSLRRLRREMANARNSSSFSWAEPGPGSTAWLVISRSLASRSVICGHNALRSASSSNHLDQAFQFHLDSLLLFTERFEPRVEGAMPLSNLLLKSRDGVID